MGFQKDLYCHHQMGHSRLLKQAINYGSGSIFENNPESHHIVDLEVAVAPSTSGDHFEANAIEYNRHF